MLLLEIDYGKSWKLISHFQKHKYNWSYASTKYFEYLKIGISWGETFSVNFYLKFNNKGVKFKLSKQCWGNNQSWWWWLESLTGGKTNTWWVLKWLSRKCDNIQSKANSIPDFEFMWFFFFFWKRGCWKVSTKILWRKYD